MKRIGLIGLIGLVGLFSCPAQLDRQALALTPTTTLSVDEAPLNEATDSAVAVGVSETKKDLSSEVKTKEDITQPTKETKGRLERILDQQQLGPLSPTNFLRWSIHFAVEEGGVLPNTVVLLLLFPMVTTVIAAARHVLGLRGFGIFTPALIAVAFLATGLTLGLALFLGTLAMATLSRFVTRQLRMQYLPRMALLILFISVGVLVAMLGIGGTPLRQGLVGQIGGGIARVGIFPILLFILLTETFISYQISHGAKHAMQITVETLLLATISYLLMDLNLMQAWVLTHPEATILLIASGNVLLGRFTGLRALEYWRFRELLRK